MSLPLGGGQPSDVGVIELQTASSKRSRFQVFIVLNSPDSTIEHFGYNLPNESEDDVLFTDLASGDLSPFMISLTVDADKRRRHSHLHSVGHMLDGAMRTIGYDSNKFKPAKGYHFNDGPYVEYEIIDANLMKEISANKESDKFFDEIVQQLQQHLELLVSQKIDTIVSYSLGNGKNGSEQLIRVVNVAGCECPCGGTHIGNTQEITERIVVTKIKRKKSILKVSYDLETV